MRNLKLLLVLLWGLTATMNAQLRYSKAKINIENKSPEVISKLGIDVTEGILKKGAFIISDYSAIELQKLKDAGFEYEILIEDVQAFYEDRNLNTSMAVEDYKSPLDDEWPVPDGFSFGSMGGFLTFDEVVSKLDDMYADFPGLITPKESIGQSLEGREMWMVRISDNPGVNEGEPEVLYTAVHHAREPESMMQMIFFMYYLLENYDSDPLVQQIVNNTDLYFIPFVNPDGYVYNQITFPYGGGMWRKNRRDNGGGSYGVDLNRNYDYKWGWDNVGSSSNPDDETYRGTDAFSEPETQNIRDFVNGHDFKLALNYHTYSNLLLYPWGWTSTETCPDDELYASYSTLMTVENNYVWGQGSTTIYPVNGEANDWFYGEQNTKNKIISFTPEVGTSDDGFWPSQARIIPLAQENMLANFLLALFAGNYAMIDEVSNLAVSQLGFFSVFDLTRLGLEDGGSFTVSIEAISDNIASVGTPKTYSNLNIQETITDSISINLSSAMTDPLIRFKLILDNGNYTIVDTITKIYGQEVSVFEDDGSNLDAWTGNWALTNEDSHSPMTSITDSPNSNYENNFTYTITMNDFVELQGDNFQLASLLFWAKWNIETGWDYAEVQISTDGSSWTALEGGHTKMGNSNQDPGVPLYDGLQEQWVMEDIDLTEYIGMDVKIRFVLVSDEYVTADGYYFDDLQIVAIDNLVGVEDENKLESHVRVFPNPSSKTLHFLLPKTGLQIQILNLSGEIIYQNKATSGMFWDLSVESWEEGVYFYKVSDASKCVKKGKILVK
jgi:hypothetical protein